MNAALKRILDGGHKFAPVEKKWFDITFVDSAGDLDNDSEFAFDITEAKWQFENHMQGTGSYKFLNIKMRSK
tara:strand:- start:436 stop:651 length:216 start_codon:yes stop_codon:yes gene_type:complete